MTRAAQAGSASVGGSASRRLQTAARLLVRAGRDWLDRPMTSLHLVLAVFVLMLGFGLLMVLSSSAAVAYNSSAGSSFAVFRNQATYAGVGLVGFFFTTRMPVRLMRTLSTAAVMVSLLLLVAVLVPGIGKIVYGARSWIDLGPFQFQPSETAKLTLLLWSAHVLAARRSALRSLRALLVPVLPVFLLMVGLVMLQPDLGTTITLAIGFFAVLYFAGAPLWIFGSTAALGLGAAAYLAMSAGYRAARVTAFLHPTTADPKFTYQLFQGLYGMGNGGLFGVGIGQSQIKWSWLPNADSDFIFAVIGEELGLIGTLIVVLLFGVLAYTGLRIARRNVEPFVKIVAAAGTVWLVGQAAINIGYVVGLLPVTGIPLPMISTGGTSLIITMVVFGLLANFARREPQAAAALHSLGPGRIAGFLGIGTAAHPAAPSRRRAKTRAQRARRDAGAERPVRSGSARPVPPTGQRESRTVAPRAVVPRTARSVPRAGAPRRGRRYRIRRALGFPLPARATPRTDPRGAVADRRGAGPGRMVRP